MLLTLPLLVAAYNYQNPNAFLPPTLAETFVAKTLFIIYAPDGSTEIVMDSQARNPNEKTK